MAYSYPYTQAFFMDQLGVETVEWNVERYDEYDSQGTGLDMQAEMADPKWSATMTLRWRYNADARKIAAKVRKLDGSRNSIMVYDPSNPYPAADPKGLILGATVVRINAINSNNFSLSLKGLPNGYKITTGDKGQVSFGTDQNYFFEFSEDGVANSSGVTGSMEIWPHIPPGVLANAIVVLAKPACKMTIKPGGFSPGRSRNIVTEGMAFELLEHI